ncbi:TatD family hydrolase [Bacteroides pyogenes]|uniref:Hydrolase TatD n=1 Tax=Bacteroides pyogenes TaxID=310300 RepID=A0A5D3EWI1_9BACE|nr:TatD family hydrolase [Bacteroides pyogenes]MBR8707479.1 3'-5' ssDNA/RNA exonuclease TatD [Bacteroides pyogenes]MBR8716325.1 3'-5' ssDNA/RNA exonuclease TatD [Bacteroides pyogenes]MBR8745739.1 3'-5' ssDNA/RNA exonuclease TatD [Bacteroides pyogenes]MBR8756161.1 3'-5' ssDNA/RNA exonuclease TatD [Bacteroides pyogenes]MBR8779349.1 3'-5' ssDNA/RNA exonuclease TatD [Bacteroides pyogenes]
MAADVNRILDIHTHRTDCLDESVYNCRLRAEGADHYDKPFRSVAAPLLESPSGSQVRYQEPSHSIEPDLSEGSCDSPYSSDALSRSIESGLSQSPSGSPHCCDAPFCSIGIHPWDLTAENSERLWDVLQRELERRKSENRPCVAIGEAGLDKLAAAPMELQVKIFERQVALSEDCRLPLIIHCVKAVDELLAVKKRLAPLQAWIWHGFRGKAQQASQLLRHGFYLSLGEHYSREAMQAIPASRLFLETDESVLDISDIIRRAAEVRGVDAECLQETLRENVQKVFFKR